MTTNVTPLVSDGDAVVEVDCTYCDVPINPETEDGVTAQQCTCGNWHHHDCAPSCSEYAYWQAYSYEEDRASDERAGG